MKTFGHANDRIGSTLAAVPAAPLAPRTPACTDAAVRYFEALLSFEIHGVAVWAALHQGNCPPILDVRRPQAFRLGRVPGAINIPLAELMPAALPVATEADLIVYGAGRDRLDAAEAALALARTGIHVRIMSGGFDAWKAEGFDIESEPTRTGLLASI